MEIDAIKVRSFNSKPGFSSASGRVRNRTQIYASEVRLKKALDTLNCTTKIALFEISVVFFPFYSVDFGPFQLSGRFLFDLGLFGRQGQTDSELA